MRHNDTIIAVIGGDKRSLFAADTLQTKGYCVRLFGFNKEEIDETKFTLSKSLPDAIGQADYILLPLPCTTNGISLNTPLYDGTITLATLVSYLHKHQWVFAGKITENIWKELQDKEIVMYDYSKRDEFAVLNAIPTAEGALQIAMERTDYTLNGSRCLVTGFGRIAKILATYLHGLGANVTVTARKERDFAYMQAYGYQYAPISKLSHHINQFDLIFNTIPEMIMDDHILQKVNLNTLIIDLASKPGGAGVFWIKKHPMHFA